MKVLVVDLDGTLIRNDLLSEGLARLAILKPLSFVRAIFLLVTRGKAKLKWFVAQQVPINAGLLPFRESVLELIASHKKKENTQVWLATGSASIYALPIAEHLDLFDRTLSSTETLNLTGTAKLDAIRDSLPAKAKFSYVGNGKVDYPILLESNEGYLVSRYDTRPRALEGSRVELLVEAAHPLRTLIRHLRLHQWAKNFLVFVPLLTAHLLFNPQAWASSCLAFLAFSASASAIYGINDLSDIWSDRAGSASKRSRALASGAIDAHFALALALLLVALSIVLGFALGQGFGYVVLSYLAMTSLYSFKLKRIVLVDVLILSLLYIVRIFAGAVAIGLELSFWILSFSTFLFFSLALLKRFSELSEARVNLSSADSSLVGRGYRVEDLQIVRSLGVSAGVMSVLIYALYINDPGIRLLYSTPSILWIGLPILTVWVSWLWLKAGRGEMHSDPIFFALQDKASLVCGALLLGAFVLAAIA